MRSIKQIKNLKGKTILLRAGFDVPIKNGKVVDSKRIEVLLPTMKFLIKKGSLVILSHQGRPKGKRNMAFTQKPLIPVLEKLLKKKIKFANYCVGTATEKMAKSLKKSDILLLENLRFEAGEEKNNQIFAKKLAKLGDIYVDDAFPDTHRAHASIVGVPKFLPSYAGFQLEEEVKNLSRVFKKPKHPFLLILGGAKFETKLPIIKRFVKTADYIFIGGALINQVLKEEGLETGVSLVENKNYDFKKILKNKKLILPEDVIVKSGKKLINKKIDEVKKDENILDIGNKSVKNLIQLIKKSKLILWNGPLGKYEDGGGKATKKTMDFLLKQKSKEIIIGGGDLVSFVPKSKLETRTYKLEPNLFVSTGGGATLEYLAKGTLPGIKVLK